MTPKEKAKELVEKFYDKIEDFDIEHVQPEIKLRTFYAKQCALIAIDEILNIGLREYLPEGGVDALRGVGYYRNPTLIFCRQVKEEIERL